MLKRGTYALGEIFLIEKLLAHCFVSSQVSAGMASVVEATHQLALLATWGKMPHESRVGGWHSHQEEASSPKTLSPWPVEESVVR